ncbi:major facilitator superfamily domain-containing protein [Aspergillus ambiguus]|uniref:MFS transporter n=1 Tax=Aspergillus ambiguus TaxID=176160 RepID=UPI003CCC9519
MTRDEHETPSPRTSSDDEINSLEEQHTRRDDHPNGVLEKQSTAASGLSVFENRAHSVISRIRSREPGQTARFTHPLSHTKTSSDVIVDFEGPDDPYRPMNWSFGKKAVTTVLYGLTTMGATWASSIFSTGTQQVSNQYHVGEEVSTLGTTLLLFGFGLGPLVWAPLSEVYGRKPAVLAPYFIAAIFSFGSATAKDLQTLMLTRFFTGFFGSAPVTNTGGVLGDIWTAEERGAAIVGYAMAVVGGPVLGPIVGGAIVQSYLGWRWTEYITGIMMFFFLLLDVIFLDESYPPVLLVYKARRLRYDSGNWALHAKHEEWDVTFKELGNKYLIRPFALLTTPICFLVALYASFVYGILYLSLAAFPVEFQEVRGWNQVVGALPFLAYLVGILFGACVNLLNQKFYIKRFKANNNFPVPEARLPPMMLGSVLFAAGLFIFGWTGDPDIHWIGPIIGAVSIGFGFFTIFQAALNYLIDTFQKVAASAVAANTFLRSLFAGCFPLFASIMFRRLGVGWASSVLGFVAVALIPIPYLFYIFGKRIRARGKWSRGSVYGY